MPNNMKKFILTVLLILIGTHAFSQSEYLDPSFSIKNKSIIVLPHDEAKDGCWTNIGEVKRYIEDKLELSGAIVVQMPKTPNSLSWLTCMHNAGQTLNGVMAGLNIASLSHPLLIIFFL